MQELFAAAATTAALPGTPGHLQVPQSCCWVPTCSLRCPPASPPAHTDTPGSCGSLMNSSNSLLSQLYIPGTTGREGFLFTGLPPCCPEPEPANNFHQANRMGTGTSRDLDPGAGEESHWHPLETTSAIFTRI